MKYLCSSCERLVVPETAELVDGTIELTCPKCEAATSLTLTSHTRPHNDTPDGASEKNDSSPKCPKCGHPRADQDACPRCGLLYDRWVEEDDNVPEQLQELWGRLGKEWENRELHQEFVTRALALDQLAYAARCYRKLDDPMAEKQLDALTTIGVQAMQLAEAPARLNPKPFRIIGWAVFIIICLGLATLAFMARS